MKRVVMAVAVLLVVALVAAAVWILPFAARTTVVSPTAETAFHWPYYLYVPASARDHLVVLVLPNNTGRPDDDQAIHARRALLRLFRERGFADELGVALLVPAFPRPAREWQVYTHALDRDSLETDLPGLGRLDWQLDAMVDDAITRLRGRGHQVDERILLAGFSAGGMFADRFTALHPRRVLATAIGSPGGWPIAPRAEVAGQRLRYPIGIADVPFDADAFRRVPRFVYLGDADQNDSLDFGDGWDAADAALVDRVFGADPQARWPAVRALQTDTAATFRLYPGVGHERTDEMNRDVLAFFRAVLP
jgi:pimeloyl-ACP methyl ester carboxylesterase